MTNRAKGWLAAILLTIGLWMLALGLALEGDTVVGGARHLGGHLLKMIG